MREIMIGKSIGALDCASHDAFTTLRLDKGNRHGLVTGATGTGKTVTLQRLAEGFSKAGVPVFAADIKGDLSGVGAPGDADGKAAERARAVGMSNWRPEGFPVRLWDVKRQTGLPIRTSLDRVGPLLTSRMLNANQVQEGTISIAFRIAEEARSPIFDLDHLRWHLSDMHANRAEVSEKYGNVTAASIAAIQREILSLESQGANQMFGEPPFSVIDLMKVDKATGKGVINLLDADTLMESPRLYGSLLLWILTELFRDLPEAGDLDKPKLVLFLDEAHLLFRDAPPILLETIERIVRLVRSKGVGVYFVTQNPADVPERILAQLGNRIQHALRAYTPSEQRMVNAAARAFRVQLPKHTPTVKQWITEMGVGEAVVSVLDGSGVPTFATRVMVAPPQGHIGPLSDIERDAIRTRDAAFLPVSPDDEEHAFHARWRGERGLDEPPRRLTTEEVLAFIPDLMPPPPRNRWRPWAWAILLLIGAFVVGGNMPPDLRQRTIADIWHGRPAGTDTVVRTQPRTSEEFEQDQAAFRAKWQAEMRKRMDETNAKPVDARATPIDDAQDDGDGGEDKGEASARSGGRR